MTPFLILDHRTGIQGLDAEANADPAEAPVPGRRRTAAACGGDRAKFEG